MYPSSNKHQLQGVIESDSPIFSSRPSSTEGKLIVNSIFSVFETGSFPSSLFAFFQQFPLASEKLRSPRRTFLFSLFFKRRPKISSKFHDPMTNISGPSQSSIAPDLENPQGSRYRNQLQQLSQHNKHHRLHVDLAYELPSFLLSWTTCENFHSNPTPTSL